MRPLTLLSLAFLLPLTASQPEPTRQQALRAGQPLRTANRRSAAPPTVLAARIRTVLLDKQGGPARRRLLPAPDEARIFYARRAYAPAWSTGLRPSARARTALALLARARDYGLQPRHYAVPTLLALLDSLAQPAPTGHRVAQQARFEVLLTDGVLQFARHLRRGQSRGAAPTPLGSARPPFTQVGWVTKALASAQVRSKKHAPPVRAEQAKPSFVTRCSRSIVKKCTRSRPVSSALWGGSWRALLR